MSRSSVVVSMVEQLAQHIGFASRECRYSIGGILPWSLRAMCEVPALAAANWPEPPLMRRRKEKPRAGRASGPRTMGFVDCRIAAGRVAAYGATARLAHQLVDLRIRDRDVIAA